jgi:hypothetical protein
MIGLHRCVLQRAVEARRLRIGPARTLTCVLSSQAHGEQPACHLRACSQVKGLAWSRRSRRRRGCNSFRFVLAQFVINTTGDRSRFGAVSGRATSYVNRPVLRYCLEVRRARIVQVVSRAWKGRRRRITNQPECRHECSSARRPIDKSQRQGRRYPSRPMASQCMPDDSPVSGLAIGLPASRHTCRYPIAG